MAKNISIAFTGFPTLIIDKGEDATNTVNRTFSGGYQSAGRSPTGQLLLERENVPRKNEYTITAIARIADSVTLQNFLNLVEQDPSIEFELTDRYYLYDAGSAAWHNRVIVENVVVNAQTLHYVRLPVLLFVPQGVAPITELGAGFYRLSFIASEL